MLKKLFGRGAKKSSAVDEDEDDDAKEQSQAQSQAQAQEPSADKAEEKARDKSISRYMQQHSLADAKTISLLLLGPGGSGKSTVLKQMEKIYRGAVSARMLKDAAHYIRCNILEDMFDLASQNQILVARGHFECQLGEAAQEICARVAMLRGGHLSETRLTPALAQQLCVLWADAGLQATFNIRRTHHIMDNTPYFMAAIARIASPKYTTSFEDYVRVRHRTTGIIESSFVLPSDVAVGGWRFRVTDVGGQRTERKKWLRCFSDIHAVIYVMSLAAYDQTLFEDHCTNCYVEALSVFDKTMAHRALREVDVIVFLNKNDLFEPKMKKIAIPCAVAKELAMDIDPQRRNDADAVKAWLRKEFKARFYRGLKPDKSPRRIHFHITCATDTNQIQTVMHLIQFETVRKMMRVGMLM